MCLTRAQKEKIMLTLKEKEDIYDLLRMGFDENKKIPLASIALYLNDKKLSYQEYGYKKLRSLLNDLSFLNIESDPRNPSNVYVEILPFEMEEKSKKKEKKEKKISIQEKKKILSLLFSQYEKDKVYPLSSVSKFLIDNKVDYKKYGFSKMRKFLESFPEIILTDDKNDPTLVNVYFKENKDSKIDTYPKRKDIFVPNNLIISLKTISSLGLDNDYIIETLLKDYEKAIKEKRLTKKDDAIIFPISFISKEKENLIASIKPAGKGAPYSYYFNFLGTNKEKAKDYLTDYIFFPDYESSIDELASLARKEKWCYHNSKDKHVILKIYLQYTFYQVVTQNKLLINNESNFACFNTGLISDSYEDIYCILIKSQDKSIKQPYIFQGFAISASQGLGKIVIEHFNPLPKKATYFDSFDNLIFDNSTPIHTDYRHIILDNLDRFPLSFLNQMVLPFKEEKKIVETIEKEKSAFIKDKLYSKLEKLIEKNEMLFTLLRISLEASIQKAIRMVNYDYRNALPSYFPTRNVLSLMLPLQFTNKDEVEALLLIEKTPSGNYQGQTIFTLKQCYVNARLISPLENTFLNPDKIED